MSRQQITNARAGGMTIGELSRRTGVNIETIRYYEKIALMAVPPRTPGGRRVYGFRDQRQLGFIRRARELGFSVNEIRTLLALGKPGQAKCLDVCAIATEHLTGIRARIADLRRLERHLSQAMARCTDKDAPACAVLDALYPAV